VCVCAVTCALGGEGEVLYEAETVNGKGGQPTDTHTYTLA
jgi:hypothetical protein